MKKTNEGRSGQKSTRPKIAWDREREPSGLYNHIGYVVGNLGGQAFAPEYWIFNFGDHYRADFFPYIGQREHIGDTDRLPRGKKLCRRHLKRRVKAEKAAIKRKKKAG